MNVTNFVGQPYSFHPGGINCLFADGSVHFVVEEVNARSFFLRLSVAGGETLEPLD